MRNNRYQECADCHGTGQLPCPSELCDEGFEWTSGPEARDNRAGGCVWCDGYGWVECGACMGTGEVVSHIRLVRA